MFSYQRTAPVYPHIHRTSVTVPLQTYLLDINWRDTWPIIRSIILGVIMLFSSTAIIGLDIANLAIEGKKQNSSSRLGMGPSKVGAGIWSGSISFLAALFILTIIFVRNKRIAATFALLAVTLAFFFTIVLIGLIANTIQISQYVILDDQEMIQHKLLIAILSIGLFNIVLCIIFFIMYISVYFSSSTRRSTTY